MAIPPEGKVKVTVNLPENLVLRAKTVALKRTKARGRRVTLQDLIEHGLRSNLKAAP